SIPMEACYLEQNEYKPWPRAKAYDVVAPGCIQTQLALPWGGFPHPVWFKNHPQIANVKTLGGLLDRQIMETVAATEKHFEEKIRPLPKQEQERQLADMANSVQGGTPPRENTRVHRAIDVVLGRGSMNSVQCVMYGTCAYRTTGLVQAFAAHHLTYAAPRKVGFASPCEAFGHRELLQALESFGFSQAKLSS
ncbi:MAG TPA: DUF5938 domain-containing protein, partial [Candidatus Acidoferrum sp.]|nr:DUF5938 domain-containing protein [Candidatus Acidoferrum sp.]